MPITDAMVRQTAEDLYSWALRKVPDDTKAALARAMEKETKEAARQTLLLQLRSAELADMVAATERGLLLTTLWYIRTVDPTTLLLTGLTRGLG